MFDGSPLALLLIKVVVSNYLFDNFSLKVENEKLRKEFKNRSIPYDVTSNNLTSMHAEEKNSSDAGISVDRLEANILNKILGSSLEKVVVGATSVRRGHCAMYPSQW